MEIDKTVIRKSVKGNSVDAKTVIRPKNAKVDRTVVRPRPGASVNQTAKSEQAGFVHNKQPAQNKKILQNRFELVRVLGVGGMGVVFKARDLRKVEARDRNPFIAIKVLNDEFKQHPDALIALQREARKSQSLAHPNIVNVHDFDRDGDTVFMTMEFLEGMPLDQLIKQYQYIGLPLDEAWQVFRGLCDALIHAHSENIIHADFKPANIYITNKGVAKVFDFGIARAVQQVGQRIYADDKTVFDAGNLGALTPSYASLEMLEGSKPGIKDDVYALACVTYELFSGEHPFGRLPADKAARKGLKPKRIKELSSLQWSALKQALAFKSASRIDSVVKFKEQFLRKSTSTGKIITFILFVFATSISATYYLVNSESNISSVSSIDSGEINRQQQQLQKLLDTPDLLADKWNEDTWYAFKYLWKALPERDAWIVKKESEVVSMFASRIADLIATRNMDDASELLSNAARYTDHYGILDVQKTSYKNAELTIKQEQQAREEQDRLKQLSEFEKRQIALRRKIIREQELESKSRIKEYNLALNDVSKHLLCKSGINPRAFGVSIRKLSQIDNDRYQKQKPKLVRSTINCINNVSKGDRSQALKLKQYAASIFPSSNLIKNLEIGYSDNCKISYAGKGGISERAVCKDILSIGEYGPRMIVVPALKSHYFAMTKYEVTVNDYNYYCQDTDKCQIRTTNLKKPITGLSPEEINNYVNWLSDSTSKTYTIPTYKQWLYTARADNEFQDPNRNCSMNSRGIVKGQSLIDAAIGKQNSWGLVNYIGNAGELVHKNGTYQVAGGTHKDAFTECTLNTVKPVAMLDKNTIGFRLVRMVSSE